MEEKEVDLRDYLRIIRKRKKVILLIFIIAVISSGIISLFLPPTYRVTSILRIGKIIDVDTLQRESVESPIAASEFLKGPGILTEIIKNFKLPYTLEKMKEKVFVEPVREAEDLVQIRVEMNDSKVALNVANYLTNKLLERHKGIKTLYENKEKLLTRYDERISDIQKELSELEKAKEEILAQYDQKIKDINKELSELEKTKEEILAQYDQKIREINEEISVLKDDINQMKKRIEEMTKKSNSLSSAESQLLVGYMEDLKGKQERYDNLMKELRDLDLAKIELKKSKQERYDRLMRELRDLDLAKIELKKSKQERYDKLIKELRDTEFSKTELERRDPLKMYPTEVIVSTYEPEKPIRPRKLLNILVAAVISLIVGVGIAFSLEYFEKEE